MTKRSETRQTAEIRTTDETGRFYTVYEHTEFISKEGEGDRGEETEGLKEFRLADGTLVEQLNPAEFRVTTDGRILTVR